MKISDTVSELNVKCFLPYIQRELVWNENQIYKLFDSLMRGYPIGTFLFWNITEKKEEIAKLEFIRDYKKKISKNNPNTEISKDSYWLVLDGQQRLQSFYIALKGSYDGKELYLNALSEKRQGEDDEDDGNDIVYETKFFKDKEDSFIIEDKDGKNNSEKKLWVKIKSFGLLDSSKIFDYCENLKLEYGKILTYDQSKITEKNVKELNRLVSSIESIYYYLEKDEDYDKVLDIFIRTNSGGTKLTKSDLLFSVIKQKWKKIDAYTEFNELIKIINKNDSFEFNTDFILKTSLVLIDKEIRYQVNNFTDKNVKLIEDIWPQMKDSIKIVIDLITEFGITSKKQLRANNSLIPLIYYTFFNKIKTYQSDKPDIVESKKVMKLWLYKVLLTSLFSSQTDEILRKSRDLIKNNKGVFPYEKLLESLPSGRTLDIKKDSFDNILYGHGNDFLVLSLLYPNFIMNPTSPQNKPTIDHIFPQDKLRDIYSQDLIHNIGNLQFLTSIENESKNNIQFDKWINTLDEQFIEKSFIPKERELWKIENYRNFIEARRKIMYEKISEMDISR